MELKINLSYDEQDELFLQLLYKDYESCYWCYKEDLALYNKDMKRYDYKWEDIENYVKTLESYEHLADYYSSRDEGKKALQAIRDKINYNNKIYNWMNGISSDVKTYKWMNGHG